MTSNRLKGLPPDLRLTMAESRHSYPALWASSVLRSSSASVNHKVLAVNVRLGKEVISDLSEASRKSTLLHFHPVLADLPEGAMKTLLSSAMVYSLARFIYIAGDPVVISEMLIWDRTPEGFTFWETVHKAVNVDWVKRNKRGEYDR